MVLNSSPLCPITGSTVIEDSPVKSVNVRTFCVDTEDVTNGIAVIVVFCWDCCSCWDDAWGAGAAGGAWAVGAAETAGCCAVGGGGGGCEIAEFDILGYNCSNWLLGTWKSKSSYTK